MKKNICKTSIVTGAYTFLLVGLWAPADLYSQIATCSTSSSSSLYSSAVGKESTATGQYSVAGGYQAEATELSAVALGKMAEADGEGSVAIGAITGAWGNYSVAIGYGAVAAGTNPVRDCTLAFGYQTAATGQYGTVMGYTTQAIGQNSIAMGYGAEARSSNCVAVGRWNVGETSNNPLLEIGNGTSETDRKNALTAWKGTGVSIANGFADVSLYVGSGLGNDAEPGSGGYVVVGETSQKNIAIDNNEIMARNNGGVSSLYLQRNGGNVRVNGVVVHTSDARLKQDIQDLNYGLKEVRQLRPVSYYWKNRENPQRSIGLTAQEVRKVMKEIVSKNNDTGMLYVDYTALTPVLINAIKELNEKSEVVMTRRNDLQDDLAALLERSRSLTAHNETAVQRAEALGQQYREKTSDIDNLIKQNRKMLDSIGPSDSSVGLRKTNPRNAAAFFTP